MYYSLVGRELEHEFLSFAEDHQLGILAWSPLAGGFLSGKYDRRNPPAGGTRFAEAGRFIPFDVERGYDIVDVVRRIAERRGATPAQIALAWLLLQPRVSSVDHRRRAPGRAPGREHPRRRHRARRRRHRRRSTPSRTPASVPRLDGTPARPGRGPAPGRARPAAAAPERPARRRLDRVRTCHAGWRRRNSRTPDAIERSSGSRIFGSLASSPRAAWLRASSQR